MEGIDLIKIGVIAARMWKNIEADVEIEFAPSNHAYRIRRVDVEDVVEFQQWRGPDDFSVWLGYSEKLGVLIAYVPIL